MNHLDYALTRADLLRECRTYISHLYLTSCWLLNAEQRENALALVERIDTEIKQEQDNGTENHTSY